MAYLGDHLAIATAQDRFDGFLDPLDETSAPSDPAPVRHGLRSVEQTRRAMLELLDTNPRSAPDAVFVSQNLVTIGAVETLHQRGREHEVALVGFNACRWPMCSDRV